MARGITEKDVFTASDALLLAGERPTIERVRQKIGRGSPNTVSPMLDAWFKGLGPRLQDPGAFAAPASVAEPVQQAAQHFWEVAQAQARGEFDRSLADALTSKQLEVDTALRNANVLRAANESQAEEMAVIREQLTAASARLDAERLAHAATSALLDDSRAQHDELRQHSAAAKALAREADARARRESDAAHERASGAERRAALQIESERTARSRAEKRTDTLEKRIDALQAEFQTTSERQLADLVSSRGQLAIASEQLREQRGVAERASARAVAAEAAMADAKLAAERAEGHVLGLQESIARFESMLAKTDARRPAKPTRATRT